MPAGGMSGLAGSLNAGKDVSLSFVSDGDTFRPSCLCICEAEGPGVLVAADDLASASSRTRSLYSALRRLRLALGKTSGLGEVGLI